MKLRSFCFVLLAAMNPFAAASPAARPVGAQLFTIRAAMERDFEGTLTRVAAMGYREVEFAGLYGRDPKAVRALLSKLHIRPVSSHIDWRRMRDDPAGAIAETKALGAPYLVFAWMPPEERQTLAQWKVLVSRLNIIGRLARAQGLRLAYHAHDFEYRPIDGVRPIDLLQQTLNPALVNFEMDIYWTIKAGDDPIALLKRFPGRYPLAHVKDMNKTDDAMADVGKGRIDFAAIFRAARPSDFAHVFVERDDGSDPLSTLEGGLRAVKAIK